MRPGDRITVQSKLVDLRESEGRLGPMVFITIETSYTNQFGELCVTQRSTAIRYSGSDARAIEHGKGESIWRSSDIMKTSKSAPS